MEYISSDTNVWLDFETIDRLDYPFRLPYTYLMNEDAIRDELLSPPDVGKRLKEMGLKEAELTEDEFYLAAEYVERFSRPSLHDCVALAIAKKRGLVLLTGDGPLRKAAKEEGVPVLGTIGVMDRLYDLKLITEQEYRYCLEKLRLHNGGRIRLPQEELDIRINKYTKE